MGERAARRPPWYVWPAGGAALLALVHARMPWLLHGSSLFGLAVALAAVLLGAAALWELRPAASVCAAIALTIFSGSWGSLGLPGFPFVPDRILLAFGVLALVLRAPGSAGLPRVRLRRVHVLLAVCVLYTVGSAAAAGTLSSKAGIFDILDRLGAIPFLMLALAPSIFGSRRDRDMLLGTLVCVGAYVGATAVFEALGPRALVFPRYIAEGDAANPFHQAGGPFQATVTEGFACFACAIASAIALSQWRGVRRAAAAAVLGLCAMGIFLSLERAVWIAAGAGVAAVLVAAPELRRLLPAAGLGALVLAAVLVASPELSGHASARASDQTPVWDRENQTSAALRMIAARPLFGFGWERYRSESIDYFRQSPDYPMTGFSVRETPLPLHDSYLSNAVELGLVGALLWLAGCVWGIGGAILSSRAPEMRPWRLGLIALAVFFAVVAAFDPLQQNFSELLLWTWAGVLLGGDGRAAGAASRGERGPSPAVAVATREA